MAAPLAVTAPSNLQNSMKSSSRRFDGKSRSLGDRDYLTFDISVHQNYQAKIKYVYKTVKVLQFLFIITLYRQKNQGI